MADTQTKRPLDGEYAPILPVADLTASLESEQVGVLAGTDVVAEYTLRQPAPRQWVAVGVVKPVTPVKFGRAAADPPSLLVGHGTSAAASLGSLARRLVAWRRGEREEPDAPRPRRETWPD